MTSTQLLLAAADALENGSDPFSSAFLAEHNVTSDQCASLADQLAIGARVVAHVIKHPNSAEGIAMMLTMTRNL